jgi:vacuolar-type H+-ATPase subunit E/Vma4
VPWHISSNEHKKIKSSIKAEKLKAQEYARRKAEYEVKKEEQRRARDAHHEQRAARLEARRRQEEIIMNVGALK